MNRYGNRNASPGLSRGSNYGNRQQTPQSAQSNGSGGGGGGGWEDLLKDALDSGFFNGVDENILAEVQKTCKCDPPPQNANAESGGTKQPPATGCCKRCKQLIRNGRRKKKGNKKNLYIESGDRGKKRAAGRGQALRGRAGGRGRSRGGGGGGGGGRSSRKSRGSRKSGGRRR